MMFYAPDINDRQETSWTASGFAETWFSPFGYDPIQDGHTDPDQGLLFDNSTGTLKVDTNGGEITGHNFTHFVDSYYDDVFRGSTPMRLFILEGVVTTRSLGVHVMTCSSLRNHRLSNTWT